MTTWVLIYIIHSASGAGGTKTTGTAVFHSQQACEAAAANFHKAYCFEDAISSDTVKAK